MRQHDPNESSSELARLRNLPLATLKLILFPIILLLKCLMKTHLKDVTINWEKPRQTSRFETVELRVNRNVLGKLALLGSATMNWFTKTSAKPKN